MSDQGRNADILQSIVDDVPYTDPPQSRIEDLLLQVKEVIEEGGGTKIKLADVSGAAVASSFNNATLTWSDPEDIVVSGAVLAKWAGTKVLRKAGSAPESITDGVVVVDSKVKNQYSSSGYEDTGLEYGVIYYYRWFPYTDQNIVTDGSAVSVTPARTIITTIPTQDGTLTYDGTVQTALWNDYDSSKMTVTGDTATNAGTHTASFTPTADYMWSDGTTTAKTADWIIGKADADATLSANAVTLDEDHLSTTVTVTNATGAVSVSSSDTALVTATYNDSTGVITIASPNQQSGTVAVTVNIAEASNYNAGTKTITVSCNYLVIVNWKDGANKGTDEQVAAMMDAANAGDITLSDYWAVGDTRSVAIASFSGNETATHVAQTVELTFVQAGLYKDTNNKDVNFIIELKNCLANGTTLEAEYMNSTDTNSGSWRDSAMRTLCNGDLFNALPEWLRTRIKTVKVTTGVYNGNTAGGTNIVTEDKVFLAAEKEVRGSRAYSVSNESDALTQFTYYTTAANRIKKTGASGSASFWWLRSPRYDDSGVFCYVGIDSQTGGMRASVGIGLAPCMCI